jgi:two-component system sensor histidine kinase MtrB
MAEPDETKDTPDRLVVSGGRSRLRRRLTVAFILVAVGTGAVLVATTYFLVRHYRVSTFEQRSENEARLALLPAPARLTPTSFEDLVLEYQTRSSVDGVVVVDADGDTYSSVLRRADVPSDVLEPGDADELATATVRSSAGSFYVVSGRHEGATYAFAFDRAEVTESIDQTRDLLLIGWVIATVFAAIVGRRVARRTLVPVSEAAAASKALADGLLDTRLPHAGSDEFEALAASFNEMADALEAKIHELSEAAARERRFTANVAHELRTPLTAMASASALIDGELDDVPPHLRRPLELLVEEVDRLRRLVADLLELARHDAGHEIVELEQLRLGDAIEALVDAQYADRVELDVPDDLWVWADRRRFGRVVGNLVANAVEHGGGRVELVGRREPPWVVLDVLDRGPGLSGADIPRLFDRFYKSDESRSGSGAGLGLAIARENARLQRGVLEAAPRPGGGARFTLRLRLAPSLDAPREDALQGPAVPR